MPEPSSPSGGWIVTRRGRYDTRSHSPPLTPERRLQVESIELVSGAQNDEMAMSTTFPSCLQFRLLVAVMLTGLAGCAAGPNYSPPDPPSTIGYTRERLRDPSGAAAVKTAQGGSPAQHFATGEDVQGRWWTAFASPALNRLVDEALENNPTLVVAQASLAAAYEEAEAQKGTLLPTLTGHGLASYQEAPNGGLQSPLSNQQRYAYALYTPRASIAYSPDIFGGDRRLIESLEAQAEAKRYELEVTYLTLTTNVVLAAIQEAALRGEIEATNKAVKAQTDILDLYQKEFALGQVAQSEVVQQRANLSVSQLLLPPLEKQLATQRNLITALSGRLPSDEVAQTFTLASLRLPTKLPVSLPSELVEQRPDIRAADALVHSAGAEVGVALANRLPRFSITSDNGGSGITFTKLAQSGGFYSIVGTVSQPLFDAGTLYHKQRAAEDRLTAAQANYKVRVLAAFREVADVLRSLQIDAKAVAAATAAEKATSDSFELTRKERTVGMSNNLQVFLSQQTYLTALVSSAQTKALQYADTAALFQVLGGGWWNRRDVFPPRPGNDFFKFL